MCRVAWALSEPRLGMGGWQGRGRAKVRAQQGQAAGRSSSLVCLAAAPLTLHGGLWHTPIQRLPGTV